MEGPADGQTVTYDTAGNVTGCGGVTYTWGSGNRLTAITGSGKDVSYTYDMSGRISKIVSGSQTTTYNWDGDKLLMSNTDSYPIFYHCDENDQVVTAYYDGTVYHYVRNQMGDVVMLVDASGNIAVQYEYDPYGNITSITGSMAASLGLRNPFRYRVYFYDEASGCYLLGNRFSIILSGGVL